MIEIRTLNNIPTNSIIAYCVTNKPWIARLFYLGNPVFPATTQKFAFRYINKYEKNQNHIHTSIKQACKAVYNHPHNTKLNIWIFENNLEFFEWAADQMAAHLDKTEDPSHGNL